VLAQVIRDQPMRQRMGHAARHAAEHEFPLAAFRQWLLGTFVRAARPPGEAPSPSTLLSIDGARQCASRATVEHDLYDRIHYACGRNVWSDWLNVDGFDQSYPGGSVPPDLASRILRADLTGPHPFPDNHFTFGYCEDFIEHIDQSDLASFLCESYRTFKAGGVLRLSSPGLDGILRRHLRGADWQAAQVLRDEAYTQWQHKHFVCFEELDRIARHVGWRLVRRCDYRVSDVPGLALETRDMQADLNLVVELVK
jgi:predicted SAM-dependent methyltransferase